MSARSYILVLALGILSLLLLMTPLRVNNELSPVESLLVFPNITLFSILFYVWVCLCLIIAFQKVDATSRSAHLLVISLLSLVFLGFWIWATPWGRYPDDLFTLAHVQYVQDNSRIVSSNIPGLVYFNWPGLPILGAIVSDVLGIDSFTTRIVIVISVVLSLPVLFYFLSHRSLASQKLATLAAVIFVIGDADLARSINFAPVMLGSVLFLLFLLTWKKYACTNKISDLILLVILSASVTTTYFPATVCLIVISFATYVFHKMSKNKTKSHGLKVFLVSTSMFLIWNINWASDQIIASFDKIKLALVTNQFVFFQNTTGGGVEKVPLWANFSQFSCIILVYGIGSVYAISKVLKRPSNQSESMDVAGFVGVVVFSIILFALSPQGSQFQRFLIYAPFFTIPLGILYISRRPKKNLILLILVFFILALSFPAFLTENKHFSTYTFSKTDNMSFEYLKRYSGENLPQIYSQAYVTWTARFYLPGAQLFSEPPFFANQSDIWGELLSLHNLFNNSTESPRLFIMSNQVEQFIYVNYPATSQFDPNKEMLSERLGSNDRVYDNSFVESFSP